MDVATPVHIPSAKPIQIVATVLTVLAVVWSPDPVLAQLVDWHAHTSFTSVSEVDVSSGEVWVATSGGVFSYAPESGDIRRFTVLDGLHRIDARTLTVDERNGSVWIGYADGVLDRLDPYTGTVVAYRDIERAGQFASRGVNRIRLEGDSLLVATDFGVVVFDSERGEVRDAYTRLGSFQPGIAVHDALVAMLDHERRIWVATDEGVAYAPMYGPNLQDPSTWLNEADDFPVDFRKVRSLAVHRDRLYAGTERDLWERTASGYVPTSSSGWWVNRLQTHDGVLYGVSRFNAVIIDGDGSRYRVVIPDHQDPQSIAVAPDGIIWIGDRFGGLLETAYPEFGGPMEINRVVVPEGPAESQFTDLDLASDGTLWTTGFTSAQSGFHRRLPDGTWTTFSRRTREELASGSRYLHVHAAPDGSGWAGSDGTALARATPDGGVEVYDHTNSSLQAATGTEDYVIVGGLDSERNGALWVSTRGSGVPLHVRLPDGTWTGLPPYVGDGLTARATAYGRIFVDSYDQKWVIVHDENNFRQVRGLLVLGTGSTPSDPSDDTFRTFLEKGGAGQGLPGTTVTSVAEDRDGLIWIGTDAGIAYVHNSGFIAQDQNSQAIWPPWADRTFGTFALFGLHVNDLAVDPANRLWVATREGAWLIQEAEGGYELVEQFTMENSPLFSDEVVSVSIDARTGEVFFATEAGLLSYAGDAIEPSEEADDLFIYPNPFRPAEGTGMVTVEGLVEATDVRIITPGGVTVASFRARGGRLRWDGRDREGRPAPSGMYLVVAVGENGEGTATGRLAVIR